MSHPSGIAPGMALPVLAVTTLDGNISATVTCITATDFVDPLAFRLAPPSGQNCNLSNRPTYRNKPAKLMAIMANMVNITSALHQHVGIAFSPC